MSDRDLEIARAALEAAFDSQQRGLDIRGIDPAAIVAGVPEAEAADDFVERLRDFDARDCCSQRTKAADEIERLTARVAELERWNRDADAALDRWDEVWKAAGKPGLCGESKALSTATRVAELAQDAARYRWLRDEASATWVQWADDRDNGDALPNDVDAAIDNAMREGQE